MTIWPSATTTCTWSVGSLRLMARTSRPWKPMLLRVQTLPWVLLFHSFFIQAHLVMNDALVAPRGNTYPYRAYLRTLLSYRLFKAPGRWYMDQDGKYNAQEIFGLIIPRWWSPTAGSLTSRVGCTRTCCCKSDWCPTWMSGWCCCIASLRFTSWTLVANWNLMYALRWPSQRYTRSRSPPLDSYAWRRSWLLRGPNTHQPMWSPGTSP